MKRPILYFAILISYLFISACGYDLYFIKDDQKNKNITGVRVEEDASNTASLSSHFYYSTNQQNSIVLTHADIKKKKAYIQSVSKTLMNFCALARETDRRNDERYIKELGREANNYVKVYVEPIFNDPETVGNLETKAEVVKLRLLSASLYFDLEGYYQSKYHLERITEQYENDFLSSITINQMDFGANTIAEGVENLRKNIALKQPTMTNNM